ncbi:MAG: glycosyltransferase family 2 protein [Bacteroidales bacterium]|nr:glycosyltransferase family 2 protein [Bacteroidales bacterium]
MATVEALKKNYLSTESDLIIYSDGPLGLPEKTNAVNSVRNFLKSVSGFRSITINESEVNLGLAGSIVKGVSETVNKYGKVIVLEDDILTSPYFLQYMNDALTIYEQEEQVMSISGYMYPHSERLPETFFFNVPLCWGWATWKRAWDKYNGDSQYHVGHISSISGWRDFNKFGGKYLERQLRKNASGIMNTWFINWHASVFENNGFCLFPNRTLVNNIGFDQSGVNSPSTNAYFSNLAQEGIIVTKNALNEDRVAISIVKKFYFFKVNPYIRYLKKKL